MGEHISGSIHQWAGVAALMPVLLLTGCAHYLGVVKTWEKEAIVGESFRPDHLTAERMEIRCLGLSDDGILSVTVSKELVGMQQVSKEVWGTQEYNPYFGGEWIAKPIVTPIGIALFGVIFWSPTMTEAGQKRPDHNGNGKYDWYEYLYDLSSWFNPFSAAPLRDKDTKQRDIVLRKGITDQMVTNRNAVVDATVIGSITASDMQEDFASRTDTNGQTRVNLTPALETFLGNDANIHLRIEQDGKKSTAEWSQYIPAIQIYDIIYGRYGQ